MVYAGFWRRFGANLLDIIILMPLVILLTLFYKNIYLYMFAYFILLAVSFYMNVFMVKKYGGSPGKLLLKIKITQLNGEAVTWKHALMRYSVDFFISLPSTVAIFYTYFKHQDLANAHSYLEFAKQLTAYLPKYIKSFRNLTQIWFWSELLVLLFNKKKRALHDFIAGTVVIRDIAITQNEEL